MNKRLRLVRQTAEKNASKTDWCVGHRTWKISSCGQMDKASIVGDAVLYVQELQTQAKKLKAEIASLEASWAVTGLKRHQAQNETTKRIQAANSNHPVCRTILQVRSYRCYSTFIISSIMCERWPKCDSLENALWNYSDGRVPGGRTRVLREAGVPQGSRSGRVSVQGPRVADQLPCPELQPGRGCGEICIHFHSQRKKKNSLSRNRQLPLDPLKLSSLCYTILIKASDWSVSWCQQQCQVKESEQGATLPSLKPWITGALLNQGFEVKPPPPFSCA